MAYVIGTKDGSKGGGSRIERRGRLQLPRITDGITYIVVADCTETRADVETATGIPDLGSTVLFSDVLTKCISKDSEEITTISKNPYTGNLGILWEVTLKFDTNQDGDENNTEKDPTDFAPEVNWGTARIKEGMEIDWDNVKLETAAGEPMFYEDDVVFRLLEISRYERYPYDPDNLDYTDCSNENPFLGLKKGCWLMDDITTREEVIKSIRYVKVTYRLIGRKSRPKPDDPEIIEDEDTIAKIYLAHVGTLYNEVVGFDSAGSGTGTDSDPYTATVVPARAVDNRGRPIKVRLRNEESQDVLRETPPYVLFGNAKYTVFAPAGDPLNPDEPTQYRKFRAKAYADFDALNFNIPVPV